MLTQTFDGAPGLRRQADAVAAVRGCDCGCGSIDLVVAPEAEPSSCRDVTPASALFGTGAYPVGEVLLFVTGGFLSRVEVCSWGERPAVMPAPQELLID